MNSRRRTFLITGVIVVLLVAAGIGIGGYYIGKGSKTVSTQTSSSQGDISNADVQQVETLTKQYLNAFKKGTVLNDNKVNNIIETYFSGDFLSNDYPKVKNEVIDSYEGQSKLVSMQTVNGSMGYLGAVNGVTIADVQKDNVNDTITVYLRIDDIQQDDKEWIEWRSVPGEGWKVNTTSSLSLLSIGMQPISPKKNW